MEIWGKKRTSRLAFLLLLIMLFNSFGVLAEGVGEKLELTIRFDIRNNKESLYPFNGKPSELKFIITSTGDVSTEGGISGDSFIFDAYVSKAFIMREKNEDETDEQYKAFIETEKTNKSSKEYYIDLTEVRNLYKDGVVNFDNLEASSGLKFTIDGKKIANTGVSMIEEILITLDNKTLVKNDKFDDKEEEIYKKTIKDLESAVGFYGDLSSPFFRLNSLVVPRAKLKPSNKDIEDFLDKKGDPIREDKNDYFFNLVGYAIEDFKIVENSDRTVKIAEVEYEFIKLIGMDRFVFLKSKDKFAEVKYVDIGDYKFDYEYDKTTDNIKLRYDGDISGVNLPTGEELKTYEDFLEASKIKIFVNDEDIDGKYSELIEKEEEKARLIQRR